MFTKEHAAQNRKMAAFARQLVNSGVTDFWTLYRALAAEFPDIPPHRIHTRAAVAITEWRSRMSQNNGCS